MLPYNPCSQSHIGCQFEGDGMHHVSNFRRSSSEEKDDVSATTNRVLILSDANIHSLADVNGCRSCSGQASEQEEDREYRLHLG